MNFKHCFMTSLFNQLIIAFLSNKQRLQNQTFESIKKLNLKMNKIQGKIYNSVVVSIFRLLCMLRIVKLKTNF